MTVMAQKIDTLTDKVAGMAANQSSFVKLNEILSALNNSK
jgi:hypothetical protein